MASEESARAKMAQLRMACEQEILACRARSELLASTMRKSIKSIKPLVENVRTNRGKLAMLKDHLKGLEVAFREVLKANASKEAKHASISEAISAMILRIEHLKKAMDVQRAKKDEYEAVLLQQSLALQKSEEKNEGDAIEINNFKEATDWYQNVLGFQTVGGAGVKFIFNKIDRNDQDKVYWFVVRLDGDLYTLLHCNPEVDDIDELMKELNSTNGLFKFVRVMREKFQEISSKVLLAASTVDSDSHSISVSSFPPNSMDSQTETLIQDNSYLQYKRRQAGSLTEVVPSPGVNLASPSITTFRRSPRLREKDIFKKSEIETNAPKV